MFDTSLLTSGGICDLVLSRPLSHLPGDASFPLVLFEARTPLHVSSPWNHH